MSKDDLARFLGVSPRTINNMVDRGEALRCKKGRRVFFKVLGDLHASAQASTYAARLAQNLDEKIKWDKALDDVKALHATLHATLQAELHDAHLRTDQISRENATLHASVARLSTQLEHVTQERDALRRVVESRPLTLWSRIKLWIERVTRHAS